MPPLKSKKLKLSQVKGSKKRAKIGQRNRGQESHNTSSKTDLSNNFKEKLAQKKKAREARKKFISVASSAIFCFIILGLPISLTVGFKEGLMIGAGVPLFIIAYLYPRQALWLFLIYLPFGGTVTYTLGQGSVIFQIAKDAFYFPALVKLIQEQRRKRLPILIPKKAMPTLAILLIFCLLTLISVNSLQQMLPVCGSPAQGLVPHPQTGELVPGPCREGHPFLQGLFGIKVLLGYFPLVFCAYYLIKDKQKLFFLGRLLVVLTIICCVLGLIQFWMLKTGRCVGTRNETGIDLYKASLQARCLVGGSLLYSPAQGQIRLPGTFVSPWHWGWFLVAHAAISYTVAFSEIFSAFGSTFNRISFFWGITGLVSMILVLINAIICGQRLAFILVPSLFLILLILNIFLLSTTGGTNIKQLMIKLKKFIPILLGVIIFVIIGGIAALSFFNPDFIQERYDSFISRWQASNPFDFMSNQLNTAANISNILGRGLGTATSSARFLGKIFFLETYHAKLIYEMGFLGFLAFMIFLTHLLILTFKAYRSVRNPVISSYGASFWVFLVIITYLPYWYPLDTDPVAVYYWLFVGVILKLPEIEKQEREKLENTEEQPSSKTKKLKFKRKKISWA